MVTKRNFDVLRDCHGEISVLSSEILYPDTDLYKLCTFICYYRYNDLQECVQMSFNLSYEQQIYL